MKGSSPQRLLLAVFERLRSDLEGAVAAIRDGRVESAHQLLLNAQELVYELDLALDTDTWAGGSQLRTLYRHLMATLMEANLIKSADLVNDCLLIVRPLEESWAEAHRQLATGHEAPPVPSSTP